MCLFPIGSSTLCTIQAEMTLPTQNPTTLQILSASPEHWKTTSDWSIASVMAIRPLRNTCHQKRHSSQPAYGMDFTPDFEENEEDMEEHIVLSFSGPDVEAKEPGGGTAVRIDSARPRSSSEPASQEADNAFLKPPVEHYRARRPRPAPIPTSGEDVLGPADTLRSAPPSLPNIKPDTDLSLPPAPLCKNYHAFIDFFVKLTRCI